MMRTTTLIVLFSATSAFAQDWPQWRGPHRNGATTLPAPATWPDELRRVWRVEVGVGHSSPVVAAEHVFQFSRKGDEEVLVALTLRDGRRVWREAYEAPYSMNPAATSHGKGPKSTPLVAGGKVFTLGINGRLRAHDAKTGNVVWDRDDFSNTSPLYGNAMSPAVADGMLIVHLGNPGRGSLLALDPETGGTLWRHEGDGPGYASPMVFDVSGRRQIVTQTDAHVVGVALEDGELLWSIPFTTPYDQNIFTAIRFGAHLIYSGLEQPTVAIEVEGSETKEAWSSRASFYMSTPVLVGERLVGLSNRRRGQFVALDAKSGETIWASEGRQGDNAALVIWGDWLLALTNDAELIVLAKDANAFSPERRYTVADSPTWAHPVPTAAGVLVKDRTDLSVWKVTP